ncbi:MAG: ferritin family protein [Chloroflexi bacterium]|nr:ferritin family protein [Chloroflexota bacterium]
MSTLFSGRELIDVAVGIEKNGAAFYGTLAKSTKGLTAQSAYQELADKEKEHIAIFQGMLSRAGEYALPDNYTSEYDAYLKGLVDSTIFTTDRAAREKAMKVKSDNEAIEIGIAAEKESILFYSELQELVRRTDRDVLSRVIQEEKSHLRRLSELLDKLGSK